MDVLRSVLRIRLSPDVPLDLRDDLRASFAERAARFAPGDLVRMLSAGSELEANGSIRRSPNPRVLIEMLLLRLSYLDRTLDLEELIRALGGAPSPRGGAGAANGGSSGGADGRAGPTSEAGGVGAAASSEAEPETTPLGLSPRGPSTHPEGPPADAPRPAEAGEAHDPLPIEPVPSGSLDEAWGRWLSSGRAVPRGMAAFLRSATVTESDDVLLISPPPGPALERLAEADVRAGIASGLAPWLGRTLRVQVVEMDAGPADGMPRRIGREEVRSDTLKALYRKEPRLARAVEELDLELMD